jgi:hypothetical protein
MNTVVGILSDPDGLAYDRTRYWASPASEYRSLQAARIPVDRDHDGRWVGRVVHLERSHGSLWAVAEVSVGPYVGVWVGDERVEVEPEALYWSAERTPFDGDVLLRSLAITMSPARIAAQPLLWFEGGLANRGNWQLDGRRLDQPLAGILERADKSRFRRGPIAIHDRDQPAVDPSLAHWRRLARGAASSGDPEDDGLHHGPPSPVLAVY